MYNKEELIMVLRSRTEYHNVEGIHLNEDTLKTFADCGLFKGYAVAFKEGDVLTFDDLEHAFVFPIKQRATTVLYVSCIKNRKEQIVIPLSIFRRKPSPKYEKYEEEKAVYEQDDNLLGQRLGNNLTCTNDLDRLAALCETGEIRISGVYDIHLQSFDKDGNPVDGKFYIQKAYKVMPNE